MTPATAPADIHELLPGGWRVGPTSYEPGRRRWSVAARGPNNGNRLKPPQIVAGEGEGEDELHALTELVLALREMNRPGRMAELERRMRLAYCQGAEERSRRQVGRGMTEEEIEGVGRAYPGDRVQGSERGSTA